MSACSGVPGSRQLSRTALISGVDMQGSGPGAPVIPKHAQQQEGAQSFVRSV